MKDISKRDKLTDAIVIAIIITMTLVSMVIGHRKYKNQRLEFKATISETVLLTYKHGYTDAFNAMMNNDTIIPAKQFKIDSAEFINNYNYIFDNAKAH